ncbi:MAG: efflux RND transporter periplasmic adaptor subunit [Candidatus Gastranaerophilaceae bacterium]|jgi:multidrug efflux pump subunit AcrA (membrane-fusion protein)
MIKIDKKLAIASLSLSLLLGVTSCGRPVGMHGGIPVKSIILASTPVTQSSIYQATLISRYSVTLQPQVSGQIATINVKAGDRVKAGDLLIVVNSRKQNAILNSSRADAKALQAAISQSENMLESYQIQRKAITSNLDMNKKQYARYNALYEKKSVSQQDLEKYTDSLNKATADLEANTAQILSQKSAILVAKSNYEKAVANIQQQSTILQYYEIKAPYSGIVGDIPVKIGNYITENTVLISITQNNPLEVNVGLPVEKVFDIHKGMTIDVFDNNNNVIGTSKISFISPRVDTATQTILVKSNLANPKEILKADQSVKVRVIYSQSPGILVPTGAVSHIGAQDFVYTLVNKGNQFFAKQQPVKLGELQGDKYAVISGLKIGEQIVSAGVQKLMDGAPVTILPEGNK